MSSNTWGTCQGTRWRSRRNTSLSTPWQLLYSNCELLNGRKYPFSTVKVMLCQSESSITLTGFVFLAHLSQRLIGELIGYPWSGVRRRRPSTISNVFSSETAWPVKVKFYVEPRWEVGMKVYINGPGHMTKMAAMLIYSKNL